MYKCRIEKRILHFKVPATTSRGAYQTRTLWLVEFRNEDTQNVGVGECAPLPDLSCDALPDDVYEETLRKFAERVAKCGKINIDLLKNYPSMLIGIETALKRVETGVNCLFNNSYTRGELGITINGLVWMGSFDEMIVRLEEKLKLGFQCVKFKIGAIDFESELELVRKVRNRYSSSVVEIRVDANGGFSVSNALERIDKLSKFQIHSIEQPIRAGQVKDMAKLCSSSSLPIALDEELIGKNNYQEKHLLLKTIRPQYIVLKPSLHGGFSGTKEWIDLSKTFQIGCWITSALESNIGLSALFGWTGEMLEKQLLAPMPQGLGTGMLFTDNFDSKLEIVGDKLWYGYKR